MNSSNTQLITHLVRDNLLSSLQSSQIVNQDNIPLTSYLIKNNILSSESIAQYCAKQFGLPIYDLKNHKTIDFNINIDLIQRYRFIPLKIENNILNIGVSDPTDRHAFDAISFHTGYITQPVIILEEQLAEYIEKNFSETAINKNLIIPKELSLEITQASIQENPVNYDEPLIRFVDHMILHAIQQAASDIHIEPYETNSRIRYRQDGMLFEITQIPAQLASRLITRLKVLARLDITERRLPQDGRLQIHNIDIRINSCPTLFGEKIVLRLLNSKNNSLEINDLGFSELQKNIFLKKISQPQGLILVTGPTGSGKTVTLYTALNYLNTSEKNILTVEDPVEIQLNGINQVNINPKIGLDFSNTLRTFLRQDPDIIMVGEIRDHETAKIAVQAAQTGHLVLSTLHTNSAIETLSRLQSMGIASYNIINSISLIIAQRLIRKLCDICKQPDTFSTYFRAIGCDHCLQGYQGRIGIYEFLPISDKIAGLILSEANSIILTEQAKQEGFITLRDAGFEKVTQGVTSLTELNRVTQL